MNYKNSDKYKNDDKYKNILSTISIIKLSTLFFIGIIVMNPIYDSNISFDSKYIFFRSNVASVSLIILFVIWIFLYVVIWKYKNISIFRTIEDFIFIGTLSLLILISEKNSIQCKYLFMLSIISSTIGFGQTQGLIISAVSSITLLAIDLTSYKNAPVNVNFENDLVLCIIFFVISWILGQYVNIENIQREKLKNKLNEELTQRNHIEELLTKNEACYNLLINQSSDAILIHNDEVLMYLNEKAMKMLEINLIDEFNSKGSFDENNKIILNEKYSDILNNNKIKLTFEENIAKEDGTTLNILNTSIYCLYGNKKAILTTIKDITPSKKIAKLKEDVKRNIELLDQTKEYNRFLTEFLSNISHELKTPLNVIFSSLQLLLLYNENYESNIIEKKQEYIRVMKQNCYRLTRLINNVLDITKFDAGFITPHMENGDIVSLVEDITLSVIPYAENKDINIIFDTNIEEQIMAFDENMIERIILNLISNALKFTNKGGYIYVTVICKWGKLIISVKDTGIGIPDDKKEAIFERFVQVDKTFRRTSEGTGIGLSLVKSFVELHEGQVKLKTKLNHGSKFYIILPIKKVDGNFCDLNEIKGNITEKITMELSDIYSDSNKE